MPPEATTKTVLWLGETLGFWIQTGAFILGAIAAVALLFHNSKQARIRATIDHIIHQKTDKDLMAAVKSVYKMHDDGVLFSSFAQSVECEEFKNILTVLNNHEFIALGIRYHVFDEKIYKRLQYSNVMKVWNASRGIISEIRQNEHKDTFFQEFEWLAKRWNKAPIKKIN